MRERDATRIRRVFIKSCFASCCIIDRAHFFLLFCYIDGAVGLPLDPPHFDRGGQYGRPAGAGHVHVPQIPNELLHQTPRHRRYNALLLNEQVKHFSDLLLRLGGRFVRRGH